MLVGTETYSLLQRHSSSKDKLRDHPNFLWLRRRHHLVEEEELVDIASINVVSLSHHAILFTNTYLLWWALLITTTSILTLWWSILSLWGAITKGKMSVVTNQNKSLLLFVLPLLWVLRITTSVVLIGRHVGRIFDC
jgi:hypothetical protein